MAPETPTTTKYDPADFDTMAGLVSAALSDQVDATRKGFHRLEEAVVHTGQSAQRDMRIFSFALLVALLASIGVSVGLRVGENHATLTPPLDFGAPTSANTDTP